MNLHINYETVEPYDLKVVNTNRHAEFISASEQQPNKDEQLQQHSTVDKTLKQVRGDVNIPKAKLKALKDTGVIQLDAHTELHGIPKEAWEYKLGNRSALEWILDQYKEKKPSDPTIAEKFNTYRFANYKEQAIDLLKRVCTVSLETVSIVREMEQ